jgi:hypothetical protein
MPIPGASKTVEYRTWAGMKARCNNPNSGAFAYYGGRGIRVCAEWNGRGGFPRFLAHMGPRPSSQHSIDRIDSNGHYEPGNVRWATREVQAANRMSRKPPRVPPKGLTMGALLLGQILGVYVITREDLQRLLWRFRKRERELQAKLTEARS